MKLRHTLPSILLALIGVATLGCTHNQPSRPTLQGPTPPTLFPDTPESTAAGQPYPPAGLWPETVPPEVFETAQLLESVDIPGRDLVDVTQRLGHSSRPVPRIVRDEPWGFEIGDSHMFWVVGPERRRYLRVWARLVYETLHAYYFVEEGLDLDEAQLKRLADRFELQTYPNSRKVFGSEWTPGVDGDPHLMMLVTESIGASYQNSIDEFSKVVNRYSNEMEIIYLNAAGGQLGDDCLLAHEFQHVIQWAVDPGEETWANEGFSLVACPLNGYDTAGYKVAVDAFAQRPDTQLNSWTTDRELAYAHYGASYLFLAYYLDRFGESALRSVVADGTDGLEAFDNGLRSLDAAASSDELFADWVVANFLDDAGLADGRYGYAGLALPDFHAEVEVRAADLPVEGRASVGQYAADYIVLHGPGHFKVDFAGATVAGLTPASAHSGRYAWWSGRGTNGDATLTREFDLTGLEKATLTFYTWYDIEQDHDYAYVAASLDGQNWTTLAGQRTSNNNPNGANYGNGYTGSSSGWTQERIDLQFFVGQRVQLRFEYLTDDGPVSSGMLIDDIKIPELAYGHGAESGDGGWTGRGFSRCAPLLPQEWLLQLIIQRRNQTTVERLQLEGDRSGRWTINLGTGEMGILIVSGQTRITAEPADYWYAIADGDG
ncbi:MAG: hypothetical protein ACWGPS_08215 [Candidatus Promineifilaceae bacterium]